MKRFIAIVLCFMWMGFIFYNSSNTGKVSNTKSYAVEAYFKKHYYLLKNLLKSLIKDKEVNVSSAIKYEAQDKGNDKVSLSNDAHKANQTFFYGNGKTSFSNNDNRVNLIIRKNAHAFEYFILSMLVSFLLFSFNMKGKPALIYIMFICLFYAVTDEFHQAFVPGRTSMVSDVLIDFSGSLIGILVFYGFYYKVSSYLILKGKPTSKDVNL